MDTAVALVDAYLRFNGYISIPEQPILVGEGRPWRYHTATDLDLLAVRFPRAALVVPRDSGGPTWPDEELKLAADPLLDLHEDAVDVLVTEVKEGRPRLNDALCDATVLQAVLRRLDAGFDEPLACVVARLIAHGEAMSAAGGRRWRFRLVAFGDGAPVTTRQPFRVLPLRHAAIFLLRCMAEHHQVWRDAQFGDTVLDLLHLLDKLGLGLQRRERRDRIAPVDRAIDPTVPETDGTRAAPDAAAPPGQGAE